MPPTSVRGPSPSTARILARYLAISSGSRSTTMFSSLASAAVFSQLNEPVIMVVPSMIDAFRCMMAVAPAGRVRTTRTPLSSR